MKTSENIENRVLESLRSDSEPRDPTQLVKQLVAEGFELEEVRRSIWHLVGRKQLEFTRDWKLRALPENELVPA